MGSRLDSLPQSLDWVGRFHDSTSYGSLCGPVGFQCFIGHDRGNVLESILTLTVTNGVARTNFNHSIVGELKGWGLDSEPPTCGAWCSQMMPPHEAMGRGGSICLLNATARENATKLTMYAEVS